MTRIHCQPILRYSLSVFIIKLTTLFRIQFLLSKRGSYYSTSSTTLAPILLFYQPKRICDNTLPPCLSFEQSNTSTITKLSMLVCGTGKILPTCNILYTSVIFLKHHFSNLIKDNQKKTTLLKRLQGITKSTIILNRTARSN